VSNEILKTGLLGTDGHRKLMHFCALLIIVVVLFVTGKVEQLRDERQHNEADAFHQLFDQYRGSCR